MPKILQIEEKVDKEDAPPPAILEEMVQKQVNFHLSYLCMIHHYRFYLDTDSLQTSTIFQKERMRKIGFRSFKLWNLYK